LDEEHERIVATIRERFTLVARSPERETKFAVGRSSAERLGYSPEDLASAPAASVASFAGVGYPFAMGVPQSGDLVLDIGSGAGLDMFLAAKQVGTDGRVLGIDLVYDMVSKARASSREIQSSRTTFICGDASVLPLSNASVDLVITNGVFNLCLDKPAVVSEMFRVLRPGGRLQLADILLEEHISPEEVARKGTWSD
jgi:SAM-dependent methyltransferase